MVQEVKFMFFKGVIVSFSYLGFAPRPTRLDFGDSPTTADSSDQVSPQKANRQSKGPAPPIPTQQPHRNDQVSRIEKEKEEVLYKCGICFM